ncbi:MAG TPA: outer membrane protein assembly factor BamD [Polyangiaceae bacterium]|nr:outer membrane protein assembly factor BamD [Polyangiaceae bacterium]
MSDLKLVPPEQPTALEQRLLDAVASESPSAEQRQRVRLALGLSAIAPVPVAAAPVGRRAWPLKVAGGLSVVSVALVVLFSGIGRKSNSSEQPVVARVSQQVPVLPSPVAAVAAPIVAPIAPVAVPELPTPGAAALVHEERLPNKRASKAARMDNGADLSEQLRLIDAARSAVAAGNAGAASVALSSYRTRFPRGPFGQEAAVLQIQTLDLQGNHAQAAARARTFLARHPNSPHVGVVRRIAER